MGTIRCTKPLKAVGMTTADMATIESSMAAEGWPTSKGKLVWKHAGETRPEAKLRLACGMSRACDRPAAPAALGHVEAWIKVPGSKLAEVLAILGN